MFAALSVQRPEGSYEENIDEYLFSQCA
jgi:hypothetical protein